ncbi:MAG TPA: hypothetical protein VE173_03365, partial [Longimicrobiales bacterium]|nr:hypothetical protein [Longimicrobiales bacterium]
MPDTPTAASFRSVPADAPALIRALDRIAQAHPLDRKVLVATARGAGRELLRTLARIRGGWTGFVVETPRPFALQLATPGLARRKRRVMDEFEEEALVDEAVDVALQGGGPATAYASLAGGPGFRKAVKGAIAGLRLAGVTPDALRRAPFRNAAKRDFLVRTLSAMEEGMEARGALDIAGVLALATEALEEGEPIPADRIYLLPGLSSRGVSGRFVRALQDRGVGVLPADRVVGLDPPRGTVWREGGEGTRRSFLAAPAAAPTPSGEAASPPGSAAGGPGTAEHQD